MLLLLTFVGKVLILLPMKKSTPKTDVGGTSNRESMKTPKPKPAPKPAPKPITFGELADRNGVPAVDACAQGSYGFIYLVTIRFTSMNRTMVYVGQRSFGRKGWECYTTSSPAVRKIIESVQAGTGGGIRVELEIIRYSSTEHWANEDETSYIKAYYKQYGAHRCYNKTDAYGTYLDSGTKVKQAKFAKKKPARKPYGGSSTWSVG